MFTATQILRLPVRQGKEKPPANPEVLTTAIWALYMLLIGQTDTGKRLGIYPCLDILVPVSLFSSWQLHPLLLSLCEDIFTGCRMALDILQFNAKAQNRRSLFQLEDLAHLCVAEHRL